MKMRKIIAVLAAALMLFSILPISAMAADTYELASSIAVGDTVVLACTSKSMELNGISTTSTKYGLGVAYTGAPVGAYALTVEEGYTAGTYSFKCPNDQYLYWTSGNSLNTNATKNANTSWTVEFSGDNAIIKNAKDTARQLQWNASSPRFACYGNSGQTAVQLFKLVTGGTDEPECEHVWVDANCDTPKTCSVCGDTEGEALGHSYVEDIIDATCTATGTATYECSVCGHSYDEEIPMIPHDYVDGFCSVCGAEEPNFATIDLSDNQNRTELTTSVQKWEQNGITVTNNKGGSSSNVADYTPPRFYKGSEVVISYIGNMTKIEFTASSASYAEDLAAGDFDGATATVDGSVVTFTIDPPVNSFSIVMSGGQVRMGNSITVYGASSGEDSDCEHDYVATETEPTCGAAGVITYTCSLCGDNYTEEGAPATGEHTYEGYVCSVCGVINYPAEGDELTIPEATALGVVHPSNTYSENKYYVTGEIVEYYGNYATYGNVYIKDAEGNTLLIYGLYSADGSTRYDAMDVKPVIGDTITVYGVIGSFNSNAQMKSGWVVEHTAHTCVSDSEYECTDGVCTICGAAVAGTGHSYFYPCDVVCQICYQETNPDATHNIVAVEAVEATCKDNGNIAYWYCSDCGSAWADEACTQVTNRFNVIVPATGEHTYDDDFDTDCNVCGEIREVVAPITKAGTSASEDVSGVAVLFSVEAEGLAIVEGTECNADYDNAFVNGYKLIGMGAEAANYKSSVDIPCVYLWELADNSYAVRIKNIPADKLNENITFTPYVIVEIEGEQVTIYGEEVVASYNSLLG